jgi:hypothetical protein
MDVYTNIAITVVVVLAVLALGYFMMRPEKPNQS